jgi:phosphotransferase system HPr-like phosphotransfer protein
MDVKKFVEGISSLDGDFDLIEGRYIVDARSLMGIFSLDLKKPIKLRISKDSDKAINAIKSFIVENPITGHVEGL